MLHLETVKPRTFAILERLMQLAPLRPFSLVSSTALSLRYGHRTSVDLDLFHHEKFDHDQINKILIKEFGKAYQTEGKHLRWGIFCFIKDVKVDIVHYSHPRITAVEVVDNIRILLA